MVVGCQPYGPAAFTPRNIHFHSRAVVWSERNMSLKNPMTPPGIDPGTVRLVAQRLNHYATPGPRYNVKCLSSYLQTALYIFSHSILIF